MSTPDSDRQDERDRMVDEQIAPRGIHDVRVLAALRRVPRHRFISAHSDARGRAYEDSPQAIGEEQTISQPYIVALMTQSLGLTGTERVLEIGAGSGYQTAVLSLLAREIVAVERHESLAYQARQTLRETGFDANVELLVGDGSQGWLPLAPYDAILCAAVAPEVPASLKQQLAPGGRMVLPVGQEGGVQHLLVLHRPPEGSEAVVVQDMGQVGFVPLVGAQGFGLPGDLGDMDI